MKLQEKYKKITTYKCIKTLASFVYLHMKLLISGTRKATHSKDYAKLKAAIEKHYPHVTEIIHGGAKGVDTLAGIYAKEKGLKVTVIKPDYDKHAGHIAPLLRNTELVKLADVVLCYFKDSKKGGTADTARKTRLAKKPLIEILETDTPKLTHS